MVRDSIDLNQGATGLAEKKEAVYERFSRVLCYRTGSHGGDARRRVRLLAGAY
jgi:hypothetical protein